MEFNGLTDRKIEQLKKQPIIETTLSKSMDGQWLLIKTTMLDIKPITYLEKVLNKQED